MNKKRLLIALFLTVCTSVNAQQQAKSQDTEVWGPVPKVVIPAKNMGNAPSDAVVLFDGKNLDQWQNVENKEPAEWLVKDGILTVNKAAGNIETKKIFTSYQLHIEPTSYRDIWVREL